MAQLLRIPEVTPESTDWTAKIQVVDIFGPTEAREKGIKYLQLIIQDEQEDQSKALIFGDDMLCYEDLLKLYHTYYITEARIQVPRMKYESTVGAFDWILDKKTIVDPVEYKGPDALPLPKKLAAASFQQIKDYVFQTSTDITKTTFDILAVVINCSQPRYVESKLKWLQDIIIMDTSQQTLTFTLWEKTLIEDQGKKLLERLHEYPIILARRVGASKYNGVSLTSKYNTTIQFDPPYPQALELQACVTENKEMLTSLTSRSTAQSGFVIPIPTEEEVVPITTIGSQRDGHIFTIEAKMTFAADVTNLYKNLYALGCTKCGAEIRAKFTREGRCPKCKEKRTFVPRCRFEVNLQDSSGSAVGIIIGKEAEALLSLPVEEIYKRAVAQNMLTQGERTGEVFLQGNYPPLEETERNFSQTFFLIRAKKVYSQTSQASAKLYIQSCIAKQPATYPCSKLPAIATPEGSKRKQKLEVENVPEQSKSAKMKEKLEPSTPTKMN